MSKISALDHAAFAEQLTKTTGLQHLRDNFQSSGKVQVIMFHTNCHDGLMAAAIAHLGNGISTENTNPHKGDTSIFIPVNYNQEPPEVPKDTDSILIVDFSFDEDVLAEAYPGISLRQFDHHETAYKRLLGKCQCGTVEQIEGSDDSQMLMSAHKHATNQTSFVWQQHSGAMLAYRACMDYAQPKYGFDRELKKVCFDFATYVEDRDLWKFKLGDKTRACTLMLKENVEKDDVFCLINLLVDTANWAEDPTITISHNLYHMLGNYESVVRFEKKRIADLAEKAMLFVDGDGQLAALCSYTGKDASDTASAILELHPQAQYVVMYVLTPYDVFMSIRSKNGQAIKVAEKHGGGGHPNAAGAIVKDPSIIYERYFGLVKQYNESTKAAKALTE